MRRAAAEIPLPVVRRLAKYLTYIQRLRGDVVEWVSSQDLANALGLTSSTVRQDLSHIDAAGISKRGYEIALLEGIIERELGHERGFKAVIVGAGNLGRALAMNEEFRENGFNICGIFDSNEDKIGRRVGQLLTQGMKDLAGVVHRQNVEIGILAVPIDAAQKVAEQLVRAGVQGLLNLVCAHIRVPDSVALVDARILENLQELSCVMHRKKLTRE